MKFEAKWIESGCNTESVCHLFKKVWDNNKKLKEATLFITALGVYEAMLNGKRVGQFILAPGWTVYENRIQYQQYSIKELIQEKNELVITLGKGWFSSDMPGFKNSEDRERRKKRKNAILAEIHLMYENGESEIITTDESWLCGESPIRFSEIYDGEVYDASFRTEKWWQAKEFEWTKETLIPQEGEEVNEIQRVAAKELIITPKGERVIDFGQEVTGYVEFEVDAQKGDKIHILHGEVLDPEGNFYNANYRKAKSEIKYTCDEGKQTWHPRLTFFGFRYIKLEQFPGDVIPEQFTAIVVHSDMKRTGYLSCGNQKVNQLFSNIIWGQRGNFLDVPTDCPQRDERLGWTGDAQVFIKTASYNYDTQKFFKKWLRDLAVAQRPDGGVGQVIPDYLPEGLPSAAWGDAATICPWQIYLTYGDYQVLEDQFESMKKWVDYITQVTTEPYLWKGGTHYGDWLGLDAEPGNRRGATRADFIATAFYAYSTQLVIKAGKVLKRDVSYYEELHKKIISAFREEYPEYLTQTECVLAVHFNLTDKPQQTADQLAALITQAGNQMKTGFVGTPYILHVLSDWGHSDLAYTLFLRTDYPSWLYSVDKGATTIWEHWDGIMENGELWSASMNSYNHYAYGSVADWVYEKAAGIFVLEDSPGFEKIKIKPCPDKRLEWLEATIHTRRGTVTSKWCYIGDKVRYEINTPVQTQIIINDKCYNVQKGNYTFWQ